MPTARIIYVDSTLDWARFEHEWMYLFLFYCIALVVNRTCWSFPICGYHLLSTFNNQRIWIPCYRMEGPYAYRTSNLGEMHWNNPSAEEFTGWIIFQRRDSEDKFKKEFKRGIQKRNSQDGIIFQGSSSKSKFRGGIEKKNSEEEFTGWNDLPEEVFWGGFRGGIQDRNS